jgi:hypothetical protein
MATTDLEGGRIGNLTHELKPAPRALPRAHAIVAARSPIGSVVDGAPGE